MEKYGKCWKLSITLTEVPETCWDSPVNLALTVLVGEEWR